MDFLCGTTVSAASDVDRQLWSMPCVSGVLLMYRLKGFGSVPNAGPVSAHRLGKAAHGYNGMRRLLASGTAIAAGILMMTTSVSAQALSAPATSIPTVPAPIVPAAAPPAADCSVNPDPYKNYSCLDTYLGSNVAVRLY